MNEEFKDNMVPKITGHVLIRDPESGQILLDKRNTDTKINNNAIHNSRVDDATTETREQILCISDLGSDQFLPTILRGKGRRKKGIDSSDDCLHP